MLPITPNVVVILLDGVVFGQHGTFGGPVPTPNIGKLASQGPRYNRFHINGHLFAYLRDGKAHFAYNMLALDLCAITTPHAPYR